MSASEISGGALPAEAVRSQQFGTGSFRTSSFCTSAGCVEVAPLSDGQIAVRDRKNRSHAPQVYSRDEWSAFISGVKNGEFDFC